MCQPGDHRDGVSGREIGLTVDERGPVDGELEEEGRDEMAEGQQRG